MLTFFLPRVSKREKETLLKIIKKKEEERERDGASLVLSLLSNSL